MQNGVFIMRLIGHFATVAKHKYIVFVHCVKAGIPWRGFVHDFSNLGISVLFQKVNFGKSVAPSVNKCYNSGYSMDKLGYHANLRRR